jgi:hypothetical protein
MGADTMTSTWGTSWADYWGSSWRVRASQRGADGTRRRSRHAGRRITISDFDERQRVSLIERVRAAKMRHFMPNAPAPEPAHVSEGESVKAVAPVARGLQHDFAAVAREQARRERERLRQEQNAKAADEVRRSAERIQRKRDAEDREQARVNLLAIRNEEAVIALLLAA